MNRYKITLCVGILLFSVCLIGSANALTNQEMNEFSQNDIAFWDPDECTTSSGSGVSIGVCSASLPEETVKLLDSYNIREKAEQNMERYKYAEEQTGVPWQAIAALHYREGGMSSDASISNGQKLTTNGSCYKNVDGVRICGDANEDAKQAAELLIRQGQAVYGVDILTDGSMAAFGQAFLAYNRGAMYKVAGASWETSPYVMNGFDESHMNMRWQHADSWYEGRKLNNVEGKVSKTPGTLAVFAYLCGGSSSGDGQSSSSSDSIVSSGNQDGNDSSSATGTQSQVTWIGDSYSVGANSQITARFPNVDFGPGDIGSTTSYIRSCKFVSNSSTSCNAPNRSCLDILEDVINNNSVHPYVVLACGTNGGWSESDISRAKDLVGRISDSQVVVVNSRALDSRLDFTKSNERLKEFAASTSNVTLADWASAYQDSFFADDSTHPISNGGYDKWVEVIANALNGASDDDCTTYEGEYPQYFQCGESWSGLAYGGDNTICSSGCGAASIAMLATVATGKDIFPNDIAEFLGTQYYYQVPVNILDEQVGEHYGFEVVPVTYSTIEDAETKIRDYLKQGYMIHMTGANCHPGFQDSSRCSKGHLIGIFDIDADDNITLANSSYGGNQTYPLHDVVQAIQHGIFTAIRGDKSGSSKNTCGGICKNDGGSSSSAFLEGGLTEEQAQKLADYYNGPNVKASSLVLGRKDNCVSFSAWFVSTFTGVNLGTWGNGKEVAHNLQTRGGFPGGTEPRPFAVFGIPRGITLCGLSLCGHTGVVVGVDGDDIIVVDAAYNSRPAAVVHRSKAYFTNQYFDPFAYTDGSIDMEKLNRIINE